MKTNKLFIAVLLFIFALISHLQANVSLSFSEPLKASKKALFLNSGEIGDKIYTIKLDKKEYSLLIYDTNLKFIKETPFKKKNCKEDNCIDYHFSYKRTLFLNDRILVFFTTFETKTKNHLLLCQAFDLNGNFMGELTKVDNIPANKKSNSGSFFVEANNNKDKFVVIQNSPYDKKADEKFSFKVYDGNLKNTSNATIDLPHKDKKVSVVNYYLSNKGDVFMLVRVDFEKDQIVRGEDDEFFSVLSLHTSTDNSLSEHKIQVPQKNIISLDLEIDDKNEHIACAGLYSNIKPNSKAKDKDIDGFFYVNIDIKSKEVLSKTFKPIDKAMIAKLLGKKEGKELKDDKGIAPTFEVRDFVKMSDGSSYLVAENFYITEVLSCNDKGVCRTRYIYNYNNIFVIHISPAGEIISLIDIPKKQISSSNNYLLELFNANLWQDRGLYVSFSENDISLFSYKLMQKDDKLFIIYNDDPKNMSADVKSIRDVKKFAKEKKGALIMVELLPDGKYTKTQLFLNKERKVYTKINAGFKINDGVYVAPIKNKKGFGFIRFDIK